MNNMSQKDLDKLMIQSSKDKYWNDFHKHSVADTISISKSGRSIVAGVVSEVELAIKAWIKEKTKTSVGAKVRSLPYVTSLKTGQMAFLTCKTIIDLLAHNQAYTTVCRKIGSVIEGEARVNYLKKKAPNLFKKLKNQLKTCTSYRHKRTVIVLAMNRAALNFASWPTEEKVRVGAVLLDLFIQTTGVVEIQYIKTSKYKTKLVVMSTSKTSEWLEKFHLHNEESLPTLLPMITEPNDWVSPCGGGYDDSVSSTGTLVKTRDLEYLDQLPTAYMDDVYKSLNILQRTKWVVNEKVYKIFTHCFNNKLNLGGLAVNDFDEFPPKPADIDTDEDARTRWKQESVLIRKSNMKLSSKKLQVIRLNKVLKRFHKVPQFYFPYQLDFRGRAYAVPHFLNPQGDDVSRSLLLFAEGKPIQHKQQAEWLAIHGANLYGHDKVDFKSRVDFIDKQYNNIMKVAADPLTNRFWETASKPWQFLSFCMEWAAFKKSGFGYITRLPIHVDGSNNGLQLLSLLSRDEIGAKATNCTPSESPEDIYQRVADLVNIELTELVKSDDLSISTKAKYWLDFVVNRDAVKKPVMTLSYGSTFFSCKAYLELWHMEEIKSRGEYVDFKYQLQLLDFLTKIVWGTIPKVVGKALDIMEWLRECAEIITRDSMTIKWTTPTGLPVWQKYFNLNKFRIKTVLSGGVTRQITIAKADETKSSLKRQKNGISPNFIHSLDAAALMQVINLSYKFGIHNFFVVHDSYGTLCVDMEELSACIRHAHYTIFKEDLLEKLYTELQSQTKRQLPRPPEKGDLDVSLLLESVFFFA